MLVVVIRHAYAGDKARWHGSDTDRPLDATGHADARLLVTALAEFPLERIVSSPARRCLDTVTPLARTRHLAPTTWADLAAHTSRPLIETIVDPAAHHSAICTHGEVMGRLLDTLRSTATVKADAIDDDWLLRKGTAWALHIERGEVRHLRHIMPTRPDPATPTCHPRLTSPRPS